MTLEKYTELLEKYYPDMFRAYNRKSTVQLADVFMNIATDVFVNGAPAGSGFLTEETRKQRVSWEKTGTYVFDGW